MTHITCSFACIYLVPVERLRQRVEVGTPGAKLQSQLRLQEESICLEGQPLEGMVIKSHDLNEVFEGYEAMFTHDHYSPEGSQDRGQLMSVE